MSQETSSFSVFMSFVEYKVDGQADVNQLLSRACFHQWLRTRAVKPKHPEESFRKALTSHCRGIDGRKAFPREVESSLLEELRKKKVWACFEGTGCNIGKRGLQLQGYWESSGSETSSQKKPKSEKTIGKKRLSDSSMQSLDTVAHMTTWSSMYDPLYFFEDQVATVDFQSCNNYYEMPYVETKKQRVEAEKEEDFLNSFADCFPNYF